MEYIIKSSIAIAITYVLYYFFARKLTTFKYIRGYFYITIGISLMIPYYNDLISIFSKENVLVMPEFLTVIINKPVSNITLETLSSTVNENSVGKGISQLLFMDIVKVIYFIGVIFFSIRFLIGVIRILKLIFSYGIKKVNTDKLVLVENLKYPFSFFNLIFLNKSDFFNNKDNSVMLQHERVHVKQWHSIDMIFFEVLSILFWFNPFVWFFRFSIKEIHEYLADEGILKLKNYSPYEYVNLLLKQACGFNMYMPANNFNGSIIKKRVQMITTVKNKKVYILILIFLVSTVLTLTLSGYSFADNNKNPTLNTSNTNKVIKETKEVTDSIKKDKIEIFPFFNGTNNNKDSQNAFRRFLKENVVYPKELYDKGVNGDVFISYSIDENGKVYNVACDNKSMKEFYQKKLDEFQGDQEKYLKYRKRLDKITDNPILIEEALRVVNSFPVYVPAKNAKGESVKAESNLCNIYFRNPKDQERNQSFRDYVKENRKYPEEAMSKNIEGTVYLKYDLDKKGRYGNIKLASQDMKEFYTDKGNIEKVNQITENQILVDEAIRLLKERPGYYIENFDTTYRASHGMCNIDFFLPKE